MTLRLLLSVKPGLLIPLFAFVFLLSAALPAASLGQTATGPDGRSLGRSAAPPMKMAADATGAKQEVFSGSDLDVPGASGSRVPESVLTNRSFVAKGLGAMPIHAEAPTNSFLVSSDGRVGFGTDLPLGRLHVVVPIGDAGTRDLLLLDDNGNLEISGILSEASSVHLKEDIQAVDGAVVLDGLLSLPVSTWSYRTDSNGARHMGPMAQDFRAVFGLGTSDESIAVLDASGVTMASLQALAQQAADQAAVIEALRISNADLVARIQALEGN
ncbi:MAG: hypothetical protein ACI9BV_003713 [Rhodothermales bacterium]|jgi:hypothetical protein